MEKITWSEPTVGKEEFAEIQDSFAKDWLTMGPKVKKFEEEIAEYHGKKFGIAVSNGTIALDLVLKAYGIGPGDEVIVPSMTYFATASSVSYQNAIPVFVDIDKESSNLDPKRIEEAISPKTKAILYIDYGGNPADFNGLKKLAEEKNLILIQDGAQSLGGKYFGKPLVGLAEVSTISFHMAKIMTSVEGGMILTSNEEIAKELRIRRNQGESSKYHHSHLGTNARMTEITAGIGLAQFKKFPQLLKDRDNVVKQYTNFFKNSSKIELLPAKREGAEHANFFFPILVNNRDGLASYLSENGIDTRIAYPMPVYKQEVYSSGREKCRYMDSPIAEDFTSRVINLPLHSKLSENQITYISNKVIEFLSR